MTRSASSIRVGTIVVRSATRLRRWRLGHALAKFAWAFVGGFDNRANFHIDRNGEAILLERIAPFSPSLLFDVGANVGDWTRCRGDGLSVGARVHAFEPVPTTATQLRLATVRFGPRVVVHEVALGEHAERRRGSRSMLKKPTTSSSQGSRRGCAPRKCPSYNSGTGKWALETKFLLRDFMPCSRADLVDEVNEW